MRARTLALAVTLWTAVTAWPGPAAAAGPWVWPLAGPHAVSRAFDPPQTPYGPGHRGADLPGYAGQEVRAAGAGRISYAGLLAGRGVVVVVHGDLRTTYEPVSAVVHVGEQVAAGQVLGRLAAGHLGCPGACLHWGLLRGEIYLDPVLLVRRGPSRLLPVAGPVAAVGGRRAVAALPVTSATPLPAPRPAGDPAFALRAADAASAGGALAALLIGLVLLRRPAPPPDRPEAPGRATGSGSGAAASAPVEPHVLGLVDLAAERHRRRPEVA